MNHPTPSLNHQVCETTVFKLGAPQTIDGIAEVQGPLVRQPIPAARLARILHHSATDLWDVCTLTDAPQMWEEARAIASRILAACPGD